MNERELLQAARQEAEPSDEQRARVAAALAVSLAAGGVAATAKGGFLAGATGKLTVIGVLVLAVGTGVWLWPRSQVVAAAVAPAAVRTAPATPTDAGPSLPVPPPKTLPAVAVVPPAAKAAPMPRKLAGPVAARPDLAGELDVLVRARRALRAGDAAAALAALDQHAAKYPTAQLREEASALRVRVLCATGRAAEARALADDFLRTWPSSPQAPGVRATCVSPDDRQPRPRSNP